MMLLMGNKGATDEFEEMLRKKKRAHVLFYASWCPFSQKFLPIFDKYSGQTPGSCIKVIADDKESLCDRYSIEVFPTVILFENGMVSKRLDGKPHMGLQEHQLRELLGKG
jgi:thiol-disulfide isomerase/thioredoxin